MQKPLSVGKTTLIATTALTGFLVLYVGRSLALLQISPKYLVDEVWQIVNSTYVDGTFNHHDWQAVRQQYLNRSYSSQEEAYQAINQMVALLGDPYTEFFNPKEFKSLTMALNGELSGVGIELTQDKKTKNLVVVAPIKGAPAATAGILPQDMIVQINHQSTQGIRIDEAVKRITGPAGTKVQLVIQRGSGQRTFNLTRAHIEVHPGFLPYTGNINRQNWLHSPGAIYPSSSPRDEPCTSRFRAAEGKRLCSGLTF